MKHKSIGRLVVLTTLLMFIITIAGAFATWSFAEYSPDRTYHDYYVELENFYWEGSDQLPDDVLGEDHQALIEAILNGTYTDSNGTVTNIGLNNPNSYINNEINSRTDGFFLYRSDILGSMDYWEREDIDKFFDTGTSGLTFLLYFPEGQTDTYYLYTTSVTLGEEDPNIPINEQIYPVYRTKLQKNTEGVWEAVETRTGYAKSAYYQNPVTGSWLVKYPSMNPDSWTEGHLGTSSQNAIYTYIGQTTTAYTDNSATPTYYKITASSAGTIRVSSENSGHIIRVYNSQMSLVNTNGGAQGTNSVSFRASRNTTYYIEVSGDTSITFTIS